MASYTGDIDEQHQYLKPEHVDYFSLRVKDKREKTFELIAVLNDDGEKLHRQPELDARAYNVFEFALDARTFAKRHYKGIEVQRD